MSKGIGKRAADPHLFIAWAFPQDLVKERHVANTLSWILMRGVPVDLRVDENEMLALEMELALGGD